MGKQVSNGSGEKRKGLIQRKWKVNRTGRNGERNETTKNMSTESAMNGNCPTNTGESDNLGDISGCIGYKIRTG